MSRTCAYISVILGGGARLFDGVSSDVRLELACVVDAPDVTHLKYRILRR